MFLEKYVNNIYLDLIYDNYNKEYLNTLDEENFNRIYNILKNNNFYFIDDIILNYLELFEANPDYLIESLDYLKNKYGSNYVKIIGNNMNILNDLINVTLNMEEDD